MRNLHESPAPARGAERAGRPATLFSDGLIFFRSAFIMSAFGNEFLFFVMTLRVYALTGRAVDVGIFTALSFVPKMFSPLFGALVDRFGSRRVLGCASGSAALVTMCLPFVGDFALLYVLWFFLSALFILIGNARTVLMNEMTGHAAHAKSNSQVLAFLTVTRLAAPLCAAFLTRSFGEMTLIPAAAGVYIIASGAAFATHNLSASGGQKRDVPLRLFALDGFRSLWRSRDLRTLTCVGVVWRLFLGLFSSSLIVYVTSTLGRSSADYALAVAVMAAGSLAGSLAGPFFIRILRAKAAAGAGFAAYVAGLTTLAGVTDFYTALALLCVSHFALYAAVVAMHARRDQAADPALRGRAYGANTAILTPAAIVSMLAGGALIDIFGVRAVYLTAGIATMLSIGVIFFFIAAGGWIKERKNNCTGALRVTD